MKVLCLLILSYSGFKCKINMIEINHENFQNVNHTRATPGNAKAAIYLYKKIHGLG